MPKVNRVKLKKLIVESGEIKLLFESTGTTVYLLYTDSYGGPGELLGIYASEAEAEEAGAQIGQERGGEDTQVIPAVVGRRVEF